MRGFIIRTLNALCYIGIGCSVATGIAGFIVPGTLLMTALTGLLIGLLGGAANLMLVLSIIEIRQSLLPAASQLAVRFMTANTDVRPHHVGSLWQRVTVWTLPQKRQQISSHVKQKLTRFRMKLPARRRRPHIYLGQLPTQLSMPARAGASV